MTMLINNYSGGAYTTPSTDYYKHSGGQIKVNIWGTFGGGQVTFESSPDDGSNWIILDLEADGTPAIFTDVKTTIIRGMQTGDLLRASFSGGTAANLNVQITV